MPSRPAPAKFPTELAIFATGEIQLLSVGLAGAGTQSVIASIDPSTSYIVGGAASNLIWVAPSYTPPISGGPTGNPSAGTQMVIIGATQPTALEETGVAGEFTLYRAAGDMTTLAQAAVVELSIGGTAVPRTFA